ncbi:MAG: DUF1353 domain-containing protein [Hyphomicrobiales bacterium]|nr:DUF1353 domain-containing protein [Hyphomicrobiales bacterium]
MLTRRDVVKGIAAAMAGTLTPTAAEAQGRYVGSVVTRWNEDGRRMTLVNPFEYIDPSNVRWPVPAGTTVDGASIPRVFWSLIGGPFEGKYRNASVVHDFYCQVRTRPHVNVHRVFYDAMKTSGLVDRTSWLMYQAVAQFGPRWAAVKVDPKCEIVDENYDFAACSRNTAKPDVVMPALGEAELDAFLNTVESEAKPSDIEKLRAAARSR